MQFYDTFSITIVMRENKSAIGDNWFNEYNPKEHDTIEQGIIQSIYNRLPELIQFDVRKVWVFLWKKPLFKYKVEVFVVYKVEVFVVIYLWEIYPNQTVSPLMNTEFSYARGINYIFPDLAPKISVYPRVDKNYIFIHCFPLSMPRFITIIADFYD